MTEAQSTVGAELLVDRLGVGVEVEQPAAARDGGSKIAQILERQTAGDVRVLGRGLGYPRSVRKP